MNLEGKVVVVLGASSGIGEGIARAVAEAKPRALVLAARRDDLLNEIARSLKCETYVQKTDATDVNSVQNLFEQTKKRYKEVYAVVNSAGIIQKETLVENLEIEEMRRIIDTNLMSVMIVAQQAAPIFKEQGRGIYLVISSGAGRTAYIGESAYCASKAGADHAIRVLDKEWRVKGTKDIYAFSVGPGFVDTAEARRQFPQVPEKVWRDSPKPLDFGRTITEYLIDPKKKHLFQGAVHHIETVNY